MRRCGAGVTDALRWFETEVGCDMSGCHADGEERVDRSIGQNLELAISAVQL